MIEQFDASILEFFQSIHTPLLDRIMIVFTTLGEFGAIWIVVGILLLFHKKYRMYGVMVLTALLLGLIVGNGIMKNVIARPRPCWRMPDISLLIAVPKDFSFPSGHTLAACEAVTVLFFTRLRYAIPALMVTVIVIVSRMYLFVHYSTDIIGGMLLGILIGLFTVWVYRKIGKDRLGHETI